MLFLPILLTDVPAYLSRKSTGGLDIPVYTLKPHIRERVVTVITKHKSHTTIWDFFFNSSTNFLTLV